MAADPTPGRIVLYRSRTGFDVPAIIAATRESLFEPGVQRYRDTDGRFGVPTLSSPDHVHLVVFSPGLPQEPAPACARCRGPVGVGQPTQEVDGGIVHAEMRDCEVGGRMLMFDANMGGTFREWDVPLWEPRLIPDPRPGAVQRQADVELGSWRWPVVH